ncbi:MAG: hypothetical protein K0R81_3361 [Microbacterium sp.]|nr:hypothetical protein [Microbacterium sp.]
MHAVTAEDVVESAAENGCRDPGAPHEPTQHVVVHRGDEGGEADGIQGVEAGERVAQVLVEEALVAEDDARVSSSSTSWSAKTTSSLPPNCRKKVDRDTPAACAICSTEVWSYPRSANRSIAAATTAVRLDGAAASLTPEA